MRLNYSRNGWSLSFLILRPLTYRLHILDKLCLIIVTHHICTTPLVDCLKTNYFKETSKHSTFLYYIMYYIKYFCKRIKFWRIFIVELRIVSTKPVIESGELPSYYHSKRELVSRMRCCQLRGHRLLVYLLKKLSYCFYRSNNTNFFDKCWMWEEYLF